MRLAFAFAAVMILAVTGGLTLESVSAPSIAYYGLVLAGVLLVSVIDHENFYGPQRRG